MFCIECGKEYSEEVNFCSKCGVDLTQYHDSGVEITYSGFSEVPSSVKKNPLIESSVNEKDSIKNDQTMIGRNNETESTLQNPEASWPDEKERMKRVISQLEYDNHKLREEKEKLARPLSKSTNKTKKTGLPRPQSKSSENMWEKFKKWYNE